MNSQIVAMPPIQGSSPASAHPAAPARPVQPENPLLLLHRFLRGRYPLAIALAVVLAIPGGIGGYMAMRPVYASTGLVRVAPTLPRLMYANEDNQVPPMFDSFVTTQATRLSSRRVVELAVSSEDLRRAGWPGGTEGINTLTKALKVRNQRGGELITVEVQHTEPRLAQVALNAVLTAYESVQDELSGLTATQRGEALRAHQREIQSEVNSLRAIIANLAQPFGTDDLDGLHKAKMAEVTRLDSIITELEIRLASMPARDPALTSTPAQPETEVDLPPEVEVERFAAADRTLERLVAQRQSILTDIEFRSSKLGPDHRVMTELFRRREALDTQIADRVAFLKEHEIVAIGAPGSTRTGALGAGSSSAELQTILAQHRLMREQLNSEALTIGRASLDIRGRKDELSDRRQSLDETSRRLEQFEVENRYVAAGRISIIQRGDIPTAPAKDRRLPLSAFGAMGGAGLGIGFVVMLSFIRGGYRYIDDIERSAGPMALLGTVPDLDAGSAEQTALAALSVHHLRNMLQMNTPRSGGGTVYGVTSPSAGDGKTSLSLSLAMSFAAMGHRTLLIDADLIGRGLTRQLNLSDVPGLCQALKASTLNGEVHETRVANLSALPVGFADAMQPEQIARTELEDVLTRARQDFDTIIVDTGPILGSLEANLVSPMCDRVVMVVARGQRSKLLRSAMERLSRLGATCGGLVFNRAEMEDFDRSVNSVSLSGRSLRDNASQRSSKANPGALALLEAVGSQGPDSKSN
jgi:polysaccharide biosynthesis transport protein